MKTLYKLFYAVVSCHLLAGFQISANATMAQSPMVIRQPEPPLIMLTVGRDEKLYNAAYNDYSDVDGDGSFDVDYKPGVIVYYGLFDSNKCYKYSTANTRFEPFSASNATTKACGASVAWSGDFLNYVTTARIDALRRVFYGGRRSTDTATETVLERSYIPQDAHTWGKEYNPVRSTYKISQYTPFAEPTGNELQHMFANATVNGAASNPPLLRILLNRQERIWNWVAKEGPVVGGKIDPGTGGVGGGVVTPSDYVVRVLVCVKSAAFPLEDECKGYPFNNPTVWKPTGILHDYGENRTIAFGLITGSYENARKGGVVRSNIGYFDEEINLANGTFNTGINRIVGTLDKLKIAQWTGNAGAGGKYNCSGGCKDYGNPIAEMMYEGLRYFGGATTPTPAYSYTDAGSVDASLGLPRVGSINNPWLNPYRGKNVQNGFAACSSPVQMVVSDIAPTFDSDDLPGASFGAFAAPTTPTSLSGLSVSSIGNEIWGAELLGSKKYLIGESLANTGNTYDQAPTPKLANSFGTIRGLAPGEPTRQGSYYAGTVAKFGSQNPITTPGNAKVQTYAIGLAPPVPTLKIPVGGSTISLIPFAKSTGGCSFGEFVPGVTFLTNRLAGFYFNGVYNVPGFPTDNTKNSGRPIGTFRVSYEDNEQGTDNDMDTIAVYDFKVDASNKLTIDINSEYSASCVDQNMGFVISGTTTDGAFLGIRDLDGAGSAYALNDADNSYDNLDAANNPIFPKDGKLHKKYRRTFSPGTDSSAAGSIPHDPLWYAAKYGVLDLAKWDTNKAGEPNNYALVTNPGKLKQQISAALENILTQTQTSPSVTTTGSLVRSAVSLGFAGRYSYGTTSIPRPRTGVPLTASVWEGGLDAVKINDNGSLGALTWAASGFDDLVKRKKNIYTTVGTSPTLTNYLLSDAITKSGTLVDALAPGNVQIALTPALTAKFGALTSTVLKTRTAEAVVDYLSGDQSYERGNTLASEPKGALRPRKTIIGDIVNSLPVYQGKQDYGYSAVDIPGTGSYKSFVTGKISKQPLVWVGANDGMLHAIDASSGSVAYSYIPQALWGKLANLTLPSYTHTYYMDGQIAIGDVYVGGVWKTIVVAAAGAGARTIMAIDASQTPPQIMWEANADDIGYVLGSIKIAAIQTGGNNSLPSWGVFFGNGYESTVATGIVANPTKTVASLVVLNAADGTRLGRPANLTVPDGVAYNGMGSPALVAEGTPYAISAYSGDLGGNLWRFDLSGLPDTWKLAIPNSKPLFTAKRTSIDSSKGIIPQPISAEPTVSKSLSRGYWVAFGTGKFFEDADRTSTEIQSIYSVRDIATNYQIANNTGSIGAIVNLTRSNLQPYTVDSVGTKYRNLTPGVAPADALGWYADLKVAGEVASGERVLVAPIVYLPSVYFGTFIASADVCGDGSRGWFFASDLSRGGNSDQFDTNGDGVITGADLKRGAVQLTKLDGTVAAGVQSQFGLVASSDGSKMAFIGLPGEERGQANSSKAKVSSLGGVGAKNTGAGRFSWRQIQ
jgi:type IV pilus assembly protein PilY1